MSRRASYAVVAALLATLAPAGVLALRALAAGRASTGFLLGELARDPGLYLFLLVTMLAVFAGFGWTLGRQADRLYELSTTDPLTGLRNRRSLHERLDGDLAHAARYGTPLSLLVLDLDDLKDVNDRFGHRAGDAALRRVAEAIRTGSRAVDIGARWGGDEFILLAPSTAGPEALRLAERIRTLAAAESLSGPRRVSLSVGVATYDPARGPADADALIRAADDALYRAKSEGRDRVVAAPYAGSTAGAPSYSRRA